MSCHFLIKLFCYHIAGEIIAISHLASMKLLYLQLSPQMSVMPKFSEACPRYTILHPKQVCPRQNKAITICHIQANTICQEFAKDYSNGCKCPKGYNKQWQPNYATASNWAGHSSTPPSDRDYKICHSRCNRNRLSPL